MVPFESGTAVDNNNQQHKSMVIKEIRLTDEEHRAAITAYLGAHGLNVKVKVIDINKYADKNFPVGVDCDILEPVRDYPVEAAPSEEGNWKGIPDGLIALSATAPIDDIP